MAQDIRPERRLPTDYGYDLFPDDWEITGEQGEPGCVAILHGDNFSAYATCRAAGLYILSVVTAGGTTHYHDMVPPMQIRERLAVLLARRLDRDQPTP